MRLIKTDPGNTTHGTGAATGTASHNLRHGTNTARNVKNTAKMPSETKDWSVPHPTTPTRPHGNTPLKGSRTKPPPYHHTTPSIRHSFVQEINIKTRTHHANTICILRSRTTHPFPTPPRRCPRAPSHHPSPSKTMAHDGEEAKIDPLRRGKFVG